MMPTQKSCKAKIICCFVLGIVVMSFISIKSTNIFDIGYLLVVIIYFIRYLYINRNEQKGISNN